VGLAPAANALICLRPKPFQPAVSLMQAAIPARRDRPPTFNRPLKWQLNNERNETDASTTNEAEASLCTTLRANGTGCRAEALLRRCAAYSKMRTGFRKCASWKTPMIPSKVRTLLQGAHEKLRTFAERRAAVLP